MPLLASVTRSTVRESLLREALENWLSSRPCLADGPFSRVLCRARPTAALPRCRPLTCSDETLTLRPRLQKL